MHIVLTLAAGVLDAAIAPFRALSPYWPLTAVSLAFAVVVLVAFRHLSDQARLKATKNAIKAHLLELWLFRDDVGATLRAQRRILVHNARYFFLTLKPMLLLMVPMTVLFLSLDAWFGFLPLRPGDTTILSIHVEDVQRATASASIAVDDAGLDVETPALRIAATGEIDWRLKAMQPGVHTVRVMVDGHRLEKQIVISDGLMRVPRARVDSPFWQALLYPSEPPIPAEAGVTRIEVTYPSASFSLLGWHTHWLVFLFATSVVFVLLLRRVLRVEV